MYDSQSLEDCLGRDDLKRRHEASQNLAPKAAGSWKAALALQIEIEWFITLYGRHHCGLLTLLFADPQNRRTVTPEEAQAIFKKAARRLLPGLFIAYIAVLDFHRSGDVHFHLVVATRINILAGWREELDEQYRAIKQRIKKEKRQMDRGELKLCRELCRKIASDASVASLLRTLRHGLIDAGFPKPFPCELKPVRNPIGLARYLAGRYRESMARRDLRPRNSRCRRFSASYPRCVDKDLRFSPVGPSARLYRLKKAAVGEALGFDDIADVIKLYGAGWENEFRDILIPVNRFHPRGFFDAQLAALAKLRAIHLRLTPFKPLRPPAAANPEASQ